MKTTLNKIREHNPCTDGWEKLLKHLGKTKADDEPLSIATIIDSNGLNDALWCLRAVEGRDKEIRLFAVWCARQVQHLLKDQRSIDALDVAERYANGEATRDELDAARSAAWDARADAAGGSWEARAAWAAWDATWEARAAWDARAATYAARAAAWAAWDARAAAGDDSEAAGAKQEAELRRICGEVEVALADFGQTYKKLTDLLCRIHRDGGQAIGKYGVDKAYVNAVEIVLQTFDRAEKSESELARYKQGVEVEGYVVGVPSDIDANLYFASGWSRELGKLRGKVRVLVMKEEG